MVRTTIYTLKTAHKTLISAASLSRSATSRKFSNPQVRMKIGFTTENHTIGKLFFLFALLKNERGETKVFFAWRARNATEFCTVYVLDVCWKHAKLLSVKK